MHDDLSDLMGKRKYQSISGERVHGVGVPAAAEHYEKYPMAAAVRDVYRLMGDGRWYRRYIVHKIAETYNVDYMSMCEICEMAESDSGKWLCLPGDNTPSRAPGEGE